MAQTTSVLWTEQGLSEEAKEQARKNIGLDSVGDNVKFSNVMNGVDLSNADLKIETTKITTPQTIQFYKLHIKNEYNNEQEFALVPLDAQGGFLYKMEEGPIVAKEIEPGDPEKWELLRSQSSPNAYSLLTTQFMSSSDEDVDEFFGDIGLQTTDANSGNFSLVPCDKDGQYLSSLGSQCINIGPLPDTKVHHFGFYFKSSTTDKIRYIGVKGDSANQNVSITQLLVQKK